MTKRWSDIDKAQRLATQALGSCESFRIARQQSIYLTPVRDRVIEICEDYAIHVGRKLGRLPGGSRMSYEDIDGAARVGLIEAVDSFKPALRKDLKLHIWWGVKYRVGEERINGHWVVSRPDRAEARRYLGGKMTPAERALYEEMFLLQGVIPDAE